MTDNMILPEHVTPMWIIMLTITICGVLVTTIGVYGIIKLLHNEMP